LKTLQEKNACPFLQGGGEMGEMIRNFDWSRTLLGTPETWPQALQISLTNILNSGFPMFLFWGDDLTCFYNDAFRPSLGVEGKHPAIGKKGKEVWSEIWDFIGPLIQSVLETGKPVWFENQLVPFYRNGQMEEIYWTFSYSLLINDDGQPGGVLVTCMETTEAVSGRKKIEVSQNQLQFALSAANLGSWELMIKTLELKTSPICKQIFGQLHDDSFSYESLLNIIHPADRERQEQAFLQTMNSGADYDIEFKIFWPDASVHWVNMRGQLQYDKDNQPECMLGVVLDITEKKEAEIELRESEARFRNILDQAPVAIALTSGKDMVFESINAPMLQIIHKKNKNYVLGRKLSDVLPELVSQPVFTILQKVLETGETYNGKEVEAELMHEGCLQRYYFNITYSRVVDKNGIPSVLHMALDVTQQVMVRRKIEESEAKLRSILNSAPTAMGVFVGPDLIVENPNQLLIELMAAGSHIEGRPFRQLLSGLVEEDQKFIQLIDTVRATGQSFEGKEVEVYFKTEKKTRYFNINFIPLIDESGEVYAVLDVSVDVTEQVIARKKIEQSENKFRLLIEEAPFATALYTGPELIIDTVNDAMLLLWDKPASVVGKTFEQALPELDGQPFTDLLKNVYRTGVEYVAKAQSADIMIKGKMQRGWYNFNYKPIRNEAGDVYAIVHMAVEVTEQVLAGKRLEESEANLRTMVLAAPVGICVVDASTLVSEIVNDSFAEIAGRPQESIVGRILWETFSESRPIYEGILKQVIDTGIAYSANEVRRILVRNGKEEVIYVNFVYMPMKDWEGKVTKLAIYVLENTTQVVARQNIEEMVEQRTRELEKANEDLQKINKEFQRSNQNLEEFAHAASHDLKEPIRKIHFFTHQLKDQLESQLKENEKRSFSRIVNATQRMRILIDDLLLYSHVSQRPLEKEAVDLNIKLQRVQEDLELDIEEKKAVVQVGNLPVIVGYRRQLQQLFQNLISNSLKYSKADIPPRIDITSEEINSNGRRYYLIKVSDNGIGFDQKYTSKIFQMFSRLHGKTEYSGTGVGLSIVKKVVENHNGFIEVKSAVGEGSTFEIYLPV
jgi:PAS domain S-box-containing protein